MKIAVPSLGDSAKSVISDKLGRCNYIITYDTESKKYFAISNPGALMRDGSGLKAAEVVINTGANVLLSLEVGVKSYSALVKAHVDVHLLKSKSTVKVAVVKFLKKLGTKVVRSD